LVEQATELRMGPKEPHQGPYTLEFNLVSQEDVEGMVEYIKKLKGDLPITTSTTKVKTKDKKIDEMLSDKEPLLDLLKTLKAKCKTQEKLISELREYGFKFVAADVIQDYASPDMITLKEKHLDYQFMVRLVKEAKDPSNDKWDYRLVFGIKFMGEKVAKVQVYLWGKWEEVLKIGWEKEEDINFKKVETLYSFPEWMDYAERKRWRLENRKLEKNPELEPSKFYTKCKPYIKTY
jgi:hypothetical protein